MKPAGRLSLTFLAVAALCILAAGCDGLQAPVGFDGPVFDLTKPAEVAKAWASAFAERDLAAYGALLDEEFQFFPRPADAADFPWMTGASWDRAAEMGIAANMFDSDFSGFEPPVSHITFHLVVQTEWTNPAGHPWMTCQAVGQVLIGPVDGFAFNTRVEVELIQRGETYKVFAVHELDESSLAPSPGTGLLSVEETSLGSIKSLYR